jgi:hypothetical protein
MALSSISEEKRRSVAVYVLDGAWTIKQEGRSPE